MTKGTGKGRHNSPGSVISAENGVVRRLGIHISSRSRAVPTREKKWGKATRPTQNARVWGVWKVAHNMETKTPRQPTEVFLPKLFRILHRSCFERLTHEEVFPKLVPRCARLSG